MHSTYLKDHKDTEKECAELMKKIEKSINEKHCRCDNSLIKTDREKLRKQKMQCIHCKYKMIDDYLLRKNSTRTATHDTLLNDPGFMSLLIGDALNKIRC